VEGLIIFIAQIYCKGGGAVRHKPLPLKRKMILDKTTYPALK